MKQDSAFFSSRDRITGFFAALLLHTIVLTVLWRYQIIPPPSEALTVFVKCINPAAPSRIEPPAPPKPAPVPLPLPEPRPVLQPMPAAPQVITSKAPVTSPVEPVAPPPPVKPSPPAAVSTPVMSTAPAVSFATPATPTRPVALGNELSVACTERTPPNYPKQSVRLGEQGKTVLQVELDENGAVVATAVKTSSGFPRLDEAAIAAVKSWRCTPARRNGIAVRSTALQPFNFTLKGR